MSRDQGMNRRYRRFVTAAVLACAWLVASCGSDDEAGIDSIEAVGTVEGTDAFIGMAVDGNGDVMAYVCDGNKISQWFRGEASNGAIEITADSGASFFAEVDGNSTTGTVTLADGNTYSFETEAATGDAGLYRSREVTETGPGVGGWIVLPDGQLRGGITVKTTFSGLTTLKSSALRVSINDPTPWF